MQYHRMKTGRLKKPKHVIGYNSDAIKDVTKFTGNNTKVNEQLNIFISIFNFC